MLDAPRPKIAWVTRVPLGAVSAPNAALETLLKNVSTRSIYLLIRRTDLSGNKMSAQGILSKLRDTYGKIGVAFSVISEKHDRMLIYASSSSVTTPSEKEPLPVGLQSTCTPL